MKRLNGDGKSMRSLLLYFHLDRLSVFPFITITITKSANNAAGPKIMIYLKDNIVVYSVLSVQENINENDTGV